MEKLALDAAADEAETDLVEILARVQQEDDERDASAAVAAKLAQIAQGGRDEEDRTGREPEQVVPATESAPALRSHRQKLPVDYEGYGLGNFYLSTFEDIHFIE